MAMYNDMLNWLYGHRLFHNGIIDQMVLLPLMGLKVMKGCELWWYKWLACDNSITWLMKAW